MADAEEQLMHRSMDVSEEAKQIEAKPIEALSDKDNDDEESVDFDVDRETADKIESNARSAHETAQSMTLSKNAMKKIAKRQRMKDKWREERDRQKRVRQEHKEKVKQIIEEAQASGVAPDLSSLVTPKEVLKKHRQHRFRPEDMILTDQKIVVDMQFQDLMLEKELSSLRKQIMYIHAFNRRNPKPVHVHLTSVHPLQRQELVNVCADRWKGIHIEDQSYMDLFPHDQLVYLTADSDKTVDALDENKIYIIGGLVDHNRYKNKCKDIALAQGIATARLPIDAYVKLETRKVLTVNQVFEILLNVRTNGGNWKEAFLQSIPARKGVSGKVDHHGGDDEESEDEQHDDEDHQESKSEKDQTSSQQTQDTNADAEVTVKETPQNEAATNPESS
eukprot:TRINITY_DN3268_c0_g2_i1.p1 TRINITY_DN3268_c0_g2~~TRINITY_DN3268_c0_g2_i1.p1  ORF type:complete len:391 (-),score=110.93 TRINITY_DN3268_c0_g2_i1:194-1366(-)